MKPKVVMVDKLIFNGSISKLITNKPVN